MKREVLVIVIILAFSSCLQFLNGQDSRDETLRNNLKAADTYKKLGEKENEAGMLNTIAGNFFSEGIYKKAALYYEQEFSLYEKEDTRKLASASELTGKSWYYLQSDSLSSAWYETAVQNYETAGDAAGVLRCREMLGKVYTRLGLYDKALEEYGKSIESYSKTNDYKNIAAIHNQIGFLMFRKKNINQALESFTSAIGFSEKGGKDDFFLTDAWSNKAICWQNLGNETEMLSSFKKALEYAKSSGRVDETARIERIMAMIYFKKGDNYHAEVYCQSCIESAKASGSLDLLQLCYKDYSAVLETGNDFIKALEYYEKHLNLRDSLNYENRLAENRAADKIADYEAIEQKIKDEIATEEIQGLIIKNLRS